MTWLKAPKVNWHELGKKKRQTELINLLDSNPVLNNQHGQITRYLGKPEEVRELKERIFKDCLGRLDRFGKLATGVESEKLQQIILRLISDEIIKQHVLKMMADETFEESERESFRPGRIHYPAQFYVVRFDPFDNQIYYFTEDKVEHRNSIYAEFYDEFQDLKERAEIREETVKGRRPVLIVDDKMFAKIKTVPCSRNSSRPCVEIQILRNFSQNGYAKPGFPFTITPVMTKENGNQLNNVKIVSDKELKEVVKILNQKRYA